jgi:hypothetical protein
MNQSNNPKKMLRCFNCGNKSVNWITCPAIRKYEGEGYRFDVKVEEPHCELCGSTLYDREIEESIRQLAHENIVKCRAAVSNSKMPGIVYGEHQ